MPLCWLGAVQGEKSGPSQLHTLQQPKMTVEGPRLSSFLFKKGSTFEGGEKKVGKKTMGVLRR